MRVVTYFVSKLGHRTFRIPEVSFGPRSLIFGTNVPLSMFFDIEYGFYGIPKFEFLTVFRRFGSDFDVFGQFPDNNS